MNQVPPDSEITEAVESLFMATTSLNHIKRWNALVPTDAELSGDLPPGEKLVTDVPIKEFKELMDFVRLLDNLIHGRSSNDLGSVRVMLTMYCHMMESDFAPTVIWNQLRLLDGQEPSWCFTRTSKKGKVIVREYPREKFDEIEVLATRV